MDDTFEKPRRDSLPVSGLTEGADPELGLSLVELSKSLLEMWFPFFGRFGMSVRPPSLSEPTLGVFSSRLHFFHVFEGHH